MSIPRKSDVLASLNDEAQKVKEKFCEEVIEALKGFDGKSTLSITIPKGMKTEDLDSLIKDCKKSGWEVEIFFRRSQRADLQELNIK